jgi:TatD DNase family protein
MIDSHCHLEHMPDIMTEARQKMKAIISSSANPKDAERMLAMREQNKGFLFIALGFHPEYIDDYSANQLEDYIGLIRKNRDNIVAVGEVGLDYHWTKPEKREHSVEIFKKFIALSNELRLPLVIHSRNESGSGECINDVLELLEEAKGTVVLHCFSGNETNLKTALQRDYFISFATNICKSEKHRRLAKLTPLESMLLETDAPWLHPTSRELINRPWMIEESAKVIAEIKGITKEDVLAATEENAKRAFGLELK